MTTKFDIGQKVYTLFRNKVCEVAILEIYIFTSDKNIGIQYTFKDPDTSNTIKYNENFLFATKEELLKSL